MQEILNFGHYDEQTKMEENKQNLGDTNRIEANWRWQINWISLKKVQI